MASLYTLLYRLEKRGLIRGKWLEKAGVRPDRLQLEWISAAEGEKFASKIKEMQGIIDGVTKEEIEKTVQKLAAKKEKVVA